jgi:hypothetical protein
MYKPLAQMVAFRIRREHLEPWIRALMILFYEHYGKANSFNVTWYDEPKEWGSESGNKTISIDLVKNQQLLYKLTIFINTGVIQAQGQSGLSFATRDFPVLKTLVADICKFNNKNDTEH